MEIKSNKTKQKFAARPFRWGYKDIYGIGHSGTEQKNKGKKTII